MSDDTDLSTTTTGSSSGSDSENSDGSRENAASINGNAASARETFKRITEETDKKNAALERERNRASDDSDSSDRSSSADDDKKSGGLASESKENTNANSNDSSSSASNSDSDSDLTSASSPKDRQSNTKLVSGQHHDEEMELEMSSDTVDTTVYNQQGSKPQTSPSKPKSVLATASGSSSESESSSSDNLSVPNQSRDDMPKNEYEGTDGRSPGKSGTSPSAKKTESANGNDSSSTDDSDSESDSDTDSSAPKDGLKNYDHLKVSSQIKEVFEYIKAYKPTKIELPSNLKPFIPDYIPSIGTPDTFLKMERPDGAPDRLGREVLDEIAGHQTDKDIFAMQLRSSNKVRIAGDADMAVPCLEYAEKKSETVNQWIEKINELHKTKAAPSVSYSHAMPDINDSMQVWPPEFEDFLSRDGIGFTADLDVDIQEFATFCCGLVDIPVYPGCLTESLHNFFTLWSEFRANAHFQVAGGTGPDPSMLERTDYRLSTPEAIEAAMKQSDHRPTTAEGIRQAMENSMAEQRPSTSTHVKHITGNYRPDTAAAIAAVEQFKNSQEAKDGK